MSDFAERGTWRPADLRQLEIVSDDELATLSDDELVELIVSRSSLDEGGAREALSVLRDGPPEGVMYEREARADEP